MGWFTRLYDRRVVNVNINIVVAGILALGITVGVMHMADVWGTIRWLDAHLPVSYEFIINVLTFLVDVIADVAVYYVLHFLANHMPRRAPRPKGPGYTDMSFVRDASLVQFERAVLSPLLYVIALGLQHWLLKAGHTIAYSTAIGFAAGVAAVRVLHTFWMLRNEKRAIEGGTDLFAANPLLEKAIKLLMPRHATPGAPVRDAASAAGSGAGGGSEPGLAPGPLSRGNSTAAGAGLTPRPSGSPSCADPGARMGGGALPGGSDRTHGPVVPPRAGAKTPT